MTLAPITDILVQEHLYEYGIDANKIRDWFIPLNDDFCENINVKTPREERFPCTPPDSGCGIDDTCGLDEICKNDINGTICGEGG